MHDMFNAITHPEISFQLKAETTTIDRLILLFFENARDTQLSHAVRFYWLPRRDNINSMSRDDILHISSRLNREGGFMMHVKRLISQNPEILPYAPSEDKTWLESIVVLGTRGEINSNATEKGVALKQSEKDCSVLTGWPITFAPTNVLP